MVATPATSALIASPTLPLHRQIFMVVRDNIVRGLWPPGSAIPPEEALREQFGVSRVTVRRALGDLASQGLLERRHGLGTFVPHNVSQPRPDPTLALLDGLEKSAAESDVQVIEVQHGPAAPLIARLLRISHEDLPLHALRLRSIGGVPVMLTDAWVPERLGRKVTAAGLKKRALYELLLSQGVTFGRVVQAISAESANPQHARWLGIDVGAPVLTLTRLVHDLEERPVQYLTAYLSPERSRILMEIPGGKMNTLGGGQIVHDGLAANKKATRR